MPRKPKTALKRVQQTEPWWGLYAEWLSLQSPIPSLVEKQAKASSMAGQRLERKHIITLEKDPAFRELLTQQAKDMTVQAKAIYLDRMAQFAEDYILMADKAKDAEDYDKWIKYGLPMLERTLPKKEEAMKHLPHITINFGKEGFASKIEDAEFEVVQE